MKINNNGLKLALLLPVLSIILSCSQNSPGIGTSASESVPVGTEQEDGDFLRTDHFVAVVSTVPSMRGSVSQLYVRERRSESLNVSRGLENKVVLFVHGAGTPAEVAFDTPYAGKNWMSYLANRGFDTFAMDMTGYGRSFRPAVMQDRCNLSSEQQQQVFGNDCPPSYPYAATTMASDWNDIDAVVDYLREIRSVEKVHLVGWSQGGPRTLGYAALHPEKVANITVLAPAYSPNSPATEAQAPIAGAAMTKQSQSDFIANWDRQVGCSNQYESEVAAVIWQDMLASDPVGATWGTGVRRAPRTPTFGWNQAVVNATSTPVLMVAGTHDKQVDPERVRNLFADLGSSQKVYIEMTCSSHNAMWERDAEYLFDATYQWLNTGTFNGQTAGMFTQQ